MTMSEGGTAATAGSRLGPFGFGSFRALFVARFVGVLGNGIAPIALAFAVLDLGGSAAQLGVVVASRAVANVGVLMFGGVIADRLPRRIVLLGTSILAAITQGVVAVLVLSHVASIPLLALLSLLNGATAAVSLPASSALTPETVSPHLLRPANALLRMGLNGGTVLGTALGASLIAAVGPGWGIVIDALSFAIAGPLFLLVRPLDSVGRDAAPAAGEGGHDDPGSLTVEAPSSVLHDLRVGWREFSGRSWVWSIVVQFMLVNAAFTGAVAVLGPIVADHTFGRANWGLITAAETVGLIAGGIVALRWRPRRALLIGALLTGVTALPIALLAAAHRLPVTASVPVLAFGFFLGGVAIEQFSIAWDQSLQIQIPPNRLARVYSYDALGSFAAIPLGQLAIGPLAGALGTTRVLVGAASIVLCASLAIALVRDVRTLTSDANATSPHGP